MRIDEFLPSEFGHETARADGYAGSGILHTRCGGRIISAHTSIKPLHLHMYDSTVDLSPEFDEVVLAGPYPEAASHATHNECGEAEGNELNGGEADTVEKVVLRRLWWVWSKWEGGKGVERASDNIGHERRDAPCCDRGCNGGCEQDKFAAGCEKGKEQLDRRLGCCC